MLKRILAFVILIALVLVPAGCIKPSDKENSYIHSIKSYKDIPGITEDEIDAVETLRKSRSVFNYGQMHETEAFLKLDGSYAGFAAGFCELLSELFDMEFTLSLYDWEELKSGIDSMVIDFTGDLTMTPERAKIYYMTHTIAERTLRIFTYDQNPEIMNEKDIAGMKVGSLTGSVDIDHVREFYPDLMFSVVDVDTFDDAVYMLKQGYIDVFVTEGVIDPLFSKYEYIISKEMFMMVYTPVSMTTANTDLKPIIDVVNKYLVAGGIDVLFDLYKKGAEDYSRSKLERSFTAEEREYIKLLADSSETVKVALEQDNYPICFYNMTDKEFQGIAVDVLSEISELTGIKFEVVNDINTSWLQILDMLRSGRASMVSQLLYSDERKDSFLWPERPYATANYALISRTDYPSLASYQVVRAKVGVIAGSAYEDKFFEWFPGGDSSNIIRFDDQDVLLDALETGEIDLLMGSDYLLLMEQNYRERPGFKINIRFGMPMYSFFGFNINESTLCSVVDKTLFYVNTGYISDVWTNRGYDYAKQMAQQRSILFMVIAFALGVVLILTVYMLIKNRRVNLRLDKKVNEMTLNLSDNIAKLKAVISNYSGVIWSVDRSNTVTLFDGLYLDVIGVTHDFIEGKNLEVARLKNRHLDIIENVVKTMEEGPQEWISEIDSKAFSAKTTPIHDENGEVTGVVGSIDDITETIRLQQDLKEALGKAEAAVGALKSAQLTVASMFESNPQINLLFNSQFMLTDCNPEAYMFMGFENKQELLDGFADRMARSIPEFQSDGRKSTTLADRLVAAARDGSVRFETELIVGDTKKTLDVEFKKIPYDESFAIVAYVLDVTENREREIQLMRRDQELVVAVEEAKAANQAKSVFLSSMSHEIRTPMNAILGITEIQLANEKLDPGIREALDKIYNSGELLLGIINDLLDMSKIEAGKLELFISDYNTADMISDTAQLNMMRIGSKPIEFKINVDENIPGKLTGDELRIKQILNNLLSNAFKYTAEGIVGLAVKAEAEKQGSITLVLAVSDTGQGMSPEQVDKLFEEYTRFNPEVNRATEGTGLGMKITQNLILMMGGEISVDSEPGKGSVFTVRIPQNVTGDTAPLGRETAKNIEEFRLGGKAGSNRAQVVHEPMPYGSVLIVDDVETNIYVARGLMTPYELNIDSADGGLSAVDKVKNGSEYDVIFMDHMMPDMDGIEATKKIREMGYKKPIVALTANAVVGQAEMFIENGFDDFISKPIDVRQLNAVLNKHVRDKHPHEDKVQAAGEQIKPILDATTGLSARFAEIFSRDALKAIAQLEKLDDKSGNLTEDELKSYIINVHGMKSALANIGQNTISATALELEKAGRENDVQLIASGTRPLINALKALVEELAPKPEQEDVVVTEADIRLLRERLAAIKAACKTFDIQFIRDVLEELNERPWPGPVKQLLESLNEKILHSDFDDIAFLAGEYLK